MPRRKKQLSVAQLAAVSRLFGALSESSRLQLLQALHDGPMSVNELVEATGLKQANVSKQLALLFEAHLVKRERQGTTVLYEISDPMVFSLCEPKGPKPWVCG